MANKPQFTAGEIIEALKKHQGLAALAADSLGVNVYFSVKVSSTS